MFHTIDFGFGVTFDAPVLKLKHNGIDIALYDSRGRLAHCAAVAPLFVRLLRELSLPDDVVILTAGKGQSLAEAFGRELGLENVVVALDEPKSWWVETVSSERVWSVTAAHNKAFYIGDDGLELLRSGKPVVICDDVITTGASVAALGELVSNAGAKTAAALIAVAEGDKYAGRDTIEVCGKALPFKYLTRIPIF